MKETLYSFNEKHNNKTEKKKYKDNHKEEPDKNLKEIYEQTIQLGDNQTKN